MISERLKWGWLRLVLGVLQMVLASAAIVTYVYRGLETTTLLLTAFATVATLVSRHIYQGRRGAVSTQKDGLDATDKEPGQRGGR